AIIRTIRGEPPTPAEHPELPEYDTLWSLLRRCWDPNPSARPTMQEIIHELRKTIRDEQSGSLPMTSSPTVSNDSDGNDFDMDVDIPNASPATGSALEGNLPPDVAEAEETVNSISEEVSSETRRLFRELELESKDIPVARRYIEAAAEIGLTLLKIAQAVNSNENLSAGLESNARQLAELLKSLKRLSDSREVDNAILCLTGIQKCLENYFVFLRR
ncbi:hypothetical protein FRC01_012879, partial [Tulasnella sp. 417]